jgi:hypothetical protein
MEAIAMRSKVLVALRGGGFRRRRKTPRALFLAPLILCKQAKADSRKGAHLKIKERKLKFVRF